MNDYEKIIREINELPEFNGDCCPYCGAAVRSCESGILTPCRGVLTRFALYYRAAGGVNPPYPYDLKGGIVYGACFWEEQDEIQEELKADRRDRPKYERVARAYRGTRLYGAFRRAGLSVERAQELGY